MNRDLDPDLWDSVPYTAEGQELLDRRAQVRAEIDAIDKRVATVVAKGALKGWMVCIAGPGPELMFCAWGRTMSKTLAEAELLVEKLPTLPRRGT